MALAAIPPPVPKFKIEILLTLPAQETRVVIYFFYVLITEL